MSIDLGLKKIASLEFDKKNLLLKLFDANELINKVRTKNILLLDKVKNLELKLFVAREKKNMFVKVQYIYKTPLNDQTPNLQNTNSSLMTNN